MPRVPRRNSKRPSRLIYAGSDSTGMRARTSGGDFGPYRQTERQDRYALAAARLMEIEAVYPCYCTPEELEAERVAQQSRGHAPKYSGKCRDLTREQRSALEAQGPHSRAALCHASARHLRRGSHPRFGALSAGHDRRLRHPALRQDAGVQFRGGGRRQRHGDHPRDPRGRASSQHAASGRALRSARTALAAVRARLDDPRPGSSEALQAPRRDLGERVSRHGLSPRSARQLSRAARMVSG